jgi:hypothetical protein
VPLDAVSAGRERPPADPADEDAATVVLRSPGLAVDRAGNRAFIVGEGEPVAEVDLASGAVSYHPLALRVPARAAKSISGPTLSAEWLGNGLLAVTGTIYGGIDESTHLIRQTPVGLRIVDTGTWSVRTSDPAVSWIVRSGPWLVATPNGGGLRWFDLHGTPRGQLFGTRRVGDRALLGSRMLVRAGAEPRTLLVDLAAGRVVGAAPPPDSSLPGFFVGEGSILG